MEAFARHPDAAARAITFLEPDEVRACNPAVRGDVAGALHCPRTPSSSPASRWARCARTWRRRAGSATASTRPPCRRRRAARARRHLGDPLGGRPRRPRHRRGLRPPPRRRRRSRAACAGSGSRCSRRHPSPATLTTSLADADTLRYYPAYEAAPLAELGEQTRLAAAHHLQLLLVQRPDGGLTIGDTHAYGEPFDFALCEDPTDGAPGPGPADPRGGAAAGAAPLGGRVRGVHRRRRLPARADRRRGVARHRARRARHDVLPGHRRGHPAGGRGGRMIGPYALACLDMAGTTVRDDGAVEAAFTSALAAVGITPGSRPYDEAQVVVRQTMGWSKADVFAALLEPGRGERATAAFAAAYEAIVAAGEVSEIPGALQVLRELRAAGSGSASRPASRRRPATRCSTRWTGGPRSTSPCRRPTSGRGRPAPDLVLGAMARLGVDDPARGRGGGGHGQRPRGGARGGRRGRHRRPQRRPRRGARSCWPPPRRRSSPTSRG